MRFDYSQHKIYSAVGYLTIQTSYLEACIEEAHDRLCADKSSRDPITKKLENIDKVIGDQPNSAVFFIAETKSFFKDRNKIFHGQIYGRGRGGGIVISHRRSGIFNEPITEAQIQKLIDNVETLLKRWLSIRRVKQVVETRNQVDNLDT